METSLGLDWHLQDRLMISAEGFFKRYSRMPLSLRDDIALACKGDDYGTVGNEALIPTARGRAYGVETMLRWRYRSASTLYLPLLSSAVNITASLLLGTTVSFLM